MSNDFTSFFTTVLLMGFFCLLGLAVIALSLYFSYKRVRQFTGLVGSKLASWDGFVSRTGLQWELKSPTAPNPMLDRLFGSQATNKTGRVVGAYRGYPVVLSNQTRHRHRRMMVVDQKYYTEFSLSLRNPSGLQVEIWKKDGQLAFEPQDLGDYLLDASQTFSRLGQIVAPFGIIVRGQELYYVQAGMEQDSNQLYNVLEALCDLAQEVDNYRETG